MLIYLKGKKKRNYVIIVYDDKDEALNNGMGDYLEGGGQKKISRASRAIINFTLRVKFCPPPKIFLCPRLLVPGTKDNSIQNIA